MLSFIVGKRIVQSVEHFANSVKVKTVARCENDLMAEYATADENRLFTRYSPHAEEVMTIDNPPVVAEFMPQREFYVLHIPADVYSLEDVRRAGHSLVSTLES
jgi:hypothetical protein